jgi:outer membrane receptor for ferrienterochelin and colicins
MKLLLTDNIQLRTSYSRGFRAPSLRELYFFFVDINHNIRGNQDLRAETSHNFSGALRYSFENAFGAWSIEPTAFYNTISDQIALTQPSTVNGNVSDVAVLSYVNVDNFRTLGGNLNVALNTESLQANIGVAYIGRYNQLTDVSPEEIESSDTLDRSLIETEYQFSPEVQANISYNIPSMEVTLAAFYKYTGRLPRIFTDRNDDDKIVSVSQGFIEDYHTLDVTLSKPFWDNTLTLGVGGKNLFNVTDINSTVGGGESVHSSSSASSSLPVAWGRTFTLNLRVNIQ